MTQQVLHASLIISSPLLKSFMFNRIQYKTPVFQLTGLFQFTVRLASETEARFTSVERIHHYIQVLGPCHHWLSYYVCSKPRKAIKNQLLLPVSQSLSQEAPARIRGWGPPADWPQQGELVFRELEMRYQENLPLVLNRISCTIHPKEKIGIVGRTGSGRGFCGSCHCL